MRLLLAFAIAVTMAVGLGGCFFGHHQKAVVTEPIYEPMK